MNDLEIPQDTASLRQELSRLQDEIIAAMGAFSDQDFFAPQGEHWAPAGHISHLAKCIRPVAKAMALPKIALKLRFGKSKTGSRSFEEVREHYQSKLRSGEAQARGPYAPSPAEPDLSPAQGREQIMGYFTKAGRELDKALDGWSEKNLDTLQVEHPILGPMTIREILFFTLYHNYHHAQRVQERAA